MESTTGGGPFGLRLSEGLGCNAQAVARERPVLFSAPMVRALLAGAKTQTRRIVKVPYENPLGRWEPTTIGGPVGGRLATGETIPLQGAIWHTRTGYTLGCPYGQPGDRLWVREAWMPDPPIDDTWASTQWAGCREGKIAGVPDRFRHPRFCNYAADWLHGEVIWTPSIHMPRWASRITLEVTEIRVERLQDISEADALAEGIVEHPTLRPGSRVCNVDGGMMHACGPVPVYQWLWEQINGPGSWSANPWVWVLAFRCGPNLQPNVRAKLPAEADGVSLVCEGAEGAAHQACDGCRSGSA